MGATTAKTRLDGREPQGGLRATLGLAKPPLVTEIQTTKANTKTAANRRAVAAENRPRRPLLRVE